MQNILAGTRFPDAELIPVWLLGWVLEGGGGGGVYVYLYIYTDIYLDIDMVRRSTPTPQGPGWPPWGGFGVLGSA